VLHPNRANVSKDELRQKLSELYKSSKDNVSVFGFRTQFGGGKSTGFALVYDSPEAMKKFEPHYRLVRYGQANKIEKASRQQRTYNHQPGDAARRCWECNTCDGILIHPLTGKQRKNRSKEFRGKATWLL
jgi:small subunit ribosomal protein S24e